MNMALVGYARVSTLDQDSTTQIERLNAAGCTKVFSEKNQAQVKRAEPHLTNA
jgi:DNA invertase Pin-like site-specific DNA recombinase